MKKIDVDADLKRSKFFDQSNGRTSRLGLGGHVLLLGLPKVVIELEAGLMWTGGGG